MLAQVSERDQSAVVFETMATLSSLCTLTLTVNYRSTEGGASIGRQSKRAAAPLCFVFSRLRKILRHLIAEEPCGEFS